MTALTTPTGERDTPGIVATGLGGSRRRTQERRCVLVSATLAALRSGGARRPAERPLERARAVLGRMRAT